MRARLVTLIGVLACLMTASALPAQEGFPLTGTWYGDWGPSADHRNQITLVIEWDGKAASGIINPGPDVIPIKVITLDSRSWTVHIEADAKDQQGRTVPFVADGKLENIGSWKRSLSGTWSHGNVKGDFKIARD
jgi:hypothetical protein